MNSPCSHPPRPRRGEEGYLLLGLIVICFLVVLALGVAAPRVAKELERDREVESEHRAQEYVRAIQVYYRRNHSYPTSVDQLLGGRTTGISSAVNVKYLRAKYTSDEFRLIHLGEAKTEVKGFFGEPLQGLPQGNLGSAASQQSSFGGAAGTFGGSASGTGNSGSAFGSATSGFGSSPSSFGSSQAGSTPAGGTGFSLGGTSSPTPRRWLNSSRSFARSAGGRGGFKIEAMLLCK